MMFINEKTEFFEKRLSAIRTRDFWINENYFSVCLSIADDSIYYYIYYFEERKRKKYPENNRIFVQMTIKQSLMILITMTTFVFFDS